MLSLLRSSPPLAAAGVSVTRCLRGFSRSSAPCSDMSKITISGRLHRPPELTTTSTGRQCIRYTIRSWKGKEKTNYFNFLYITDNARSIEYYTGLPRGSKVVAEGEFSPYRLAKEDGTKVSGYSIFSNALHVIERGQPDEEVAGEDAQAQPAPAPTEGGKTPEHQALAESDGTPEHQAPAESDGTPEHQAPAEGDETPEPHAPN
ncbi:hypothetical protein B9Z19DRAFT_1073019 [Tuber borchii]|uniref:Single-strand binding protein family-domain-containing protein n=1 Tax=Tuber borchii TaxID=42251 RepID=A0A2T7A6K3_TUBBO|nr:hypothetical protein B9Z19DRAFT_1073019 [Tuber borchii]